MIAAQVQKFKGTRTNKLKTNLNRIVKANKSVASNSNTGNKIKIN